MKDLVHTGTPLYYEGISNRKSEWDQLPPEGGCAFDFIASSAIIEWLGEQRVIDISKNDDTRFEWYRKLSRLYSFDAVIPKLVLFDTIYLCEGMFYKENADLSRLAVHGFFKEFPRPVDRWFTRMYELLVPAVADRMGKLLADIAGRPFSSIWNKKGDDAYHELGDYSGLAKWLFVQFARDACGLASDEGQLFERMDFTLACEFIDFAEYATMGQGHFLDAQVPYVSSVVSGNASQYPCTEEPPCREDTFALYQIATSDVLGFYPTIKSFDDVLRLREDKNVRTLRDLLGRYRSAVTIADETIVSELSEELLRAKKELSYLKFTGSTTYTYVVKAASYLPVVGTVISVINDCIELLKEWKKRKCGWIYFGMKWKAQCWEPNNRMHRIGHKAGLPVMQAFYPYFPSWHIPPKNKKVDIVVSATIMVNIVNMV